MIKAVIFDMDGTLVDAQPVNYGSIKSALEEAGVAVTVEEVATQAGTGFENIIKEMLKQKGAKGDVQMILARSFEIQKERMPLVMPMPGAEQILDRLGRQMPIILASSSTKNQVLNILDITGLMRFFDPNLIISGDEVKAKKPAPDIFLHAAQKIGVQPSECAVLEDAGAGIQAAKAAGMKAIAVPNVFSRNVDFSDADLVVENLNDVSYETLQGL